MKAALTMLSNARVPVLGFVAGSGTGKTTLLTKLLPLLAEHGIRVGMIKHTHHQFDIDHPGKDSYKLRKAGAVQMLIASPFRNALIVENNIREPQLNELLLYLQQESIDLILVEGFKDEKYPKIELHRDGPGRPYLYKEDDSIIALASDTTFILTDQEHPPLLDINHPEQVMAFIIKSFLTPNL